MNSANQPPYRLRRVIGADINWFAVEEWSPRQEEYEEICDPFFFGKDEEPTEALQKGRNFIKNYIADRTGTSIFCFDKDGNPL